MSKQICICQQARLYGSASWEVTHITKPTMIRREKNKKNIYMYINTVL